MVAPTDVILSSLKYVYAPVAQIKSLDGTEAHANCIGQKLKGHSSTIQIYVKVDAIFT